MPPQPTPTNQTQHTGDHRRVLEDLIELGADLARMVHQQAKAHAESPTPNAQTLADATVAFDRIARAVRRTVLLARSLDDPARAQPGAHRTAARKRILRSIEDTIHNEVTGPRAESLHAELLDRLDSPDTEDDIDTRPVADIIGEICKDLGLNGIPGMDCWKRRTPADVALLNARAAAPRAAAAGNPHHLHAARFRGK